MAAGPLKNARHEVFAQAIAGGHKLQAAYARAGFFGKDPKLSWLLRHRPEVDGRIRWLLQSRVRTETRAFARREKTKGDLLERALKELADIAFSDIREVANWRREPVTNADGEVVDVTETVAFRDSASLPSNAAKAVKGLLFKSGRVQLEMHDKRAALESLIKLLSGDNAPAPPIVTVNQVNVGALDAMETARRLAFVIEAARQSALAKPPITINGQVSHIVASELSD